MFRFFKRSTPAKDITVIIRGVGEQTELTCKQLLASELPSKNIHLINETPFSAALLRSFEIGISSKRKWTMVIDADVLIRTNLISDLYEKAQLEPESVFAIQTEMLDKFFGGIRVGGVKIYRTSLLTEAIKLVPEVDVRPETYVIKNMHKSGYYVDITKIACGIHDFEQYYSDIFRKGFVHGMKHGVLTKHILPYWRRSSKIDHDFAVLLGGLKVSKKYTSLPKLEKDEVKQEFEHFMKTTNLKEKKSLATNMTCQDIDKIMMNYKNPPEYRLIKQEIKKMGKPKVPDIAFTKPARKHRFISPW